MTVGQEENLPDRSPPRDPAEMLAEVADWPTSGPPRLGVPQARAIVDDADRRREFLAAVRALPNGDPEREEIVERFRAASSVLRSRARNAAARTERTDRYPARVFAGTAVTGTGAGIAGPASVAAEAAFALVLIGLAGLAWSGWRRHVHKRRETDSIEAAEALERMADAMEREPGGAGGDND